jgi:PAS fold
MGHKLDLPDTPLAGLIREHAWHNSPLGPTANWPVELADALAELLAIQKPAWITWGAALIQIHNDAFLPILRDRHPAALGQPLWAVWPDARQIAEPIFDAVMTTGETIELPDQAFNLMTAGIEETRYFSLRYAPIPLKSGGVGGVMCTASETTARHLIESFDQ